MESLPALIHVNNQPVYLNAEKKLNVQGTFGPNLLLVDSAGTIIPCDASGKTEFTLQEGAHYTTRPKSHPQAAAATAAAAPRPAPTRPPTTPILPSTPRPTSLPGRPPLVPTLKAPPPSAAHMRGVRAHPYARPGAHPYARPGAMSVQRNGPTITPSIASLSAPLPLLRGLPNLARGFQIPPGRAPSIPVAARSFSAPRAMGARPAIQPAPSFPRSFRPGLGAGAPRGIASLAPRGVGGIAPATRIVPVIRPPLARPPMGRPPSAR